MKRPKKAHPRTPEGFRAPLGRALPVDAPGARPVILGVSSLPPSQAATAGFQALRQWLRSQGIQDEESMSAHLKAKGRRASPARPIGVQAQRQLLAEATAADARVAALAASYHELLRTWAAASAPEAAADLAPSRRGSARSIGDTAVSLPWECLDTVNLGNVLASRKCFLKACPAFLRGQWLKALGVALEARSTARRVCDERAEARAWKFFILLPAMLLQKTHPRS